MSGALALDFDLHIEPDGSCWVEFASNSDLARATAASQGWIAGHRCEVIASPPARVSRRRSREAEVRHPPKKSSEAALLMRIDIGSLSHTEPSQSVEYTEQTVFVLVHDEPDAEVLGSDHPIYEMSISDHLPEHEALLDHFIERALLAWTRSRT